MHDTDAIHLVLLLFRIAIGSVMLAHGVNHIWGGGKIAGTSSWFASMGMRRATVQAWTASLTEIGAGIMLVLGIATPLAAAGVIGVMVVAWAINHRGNGFFIFRPGEGWEYVLTLGFSGLLLGTTGPGDWSVDARLDLTDDLAGFTGMAVSAAGGICGAMLLLATSWRPPESS
jgi:putative oxidoreductase